jgi:ElaB/YqjD/DUF883 family membrane-anchored ribosome-binding protein
MNIMATIDKLSNAAEEAGEKIVDATRQAAETLGEKGEQLMDMEERFLKQCRACIRDYPIASISLALAAGIILSQMTHTYEYRRR